MWEPPDFGGSSFYVWKVSEMKVIQRRVSLLSLPGTEPFPVKEKPFLDKRNTGLGLTVCLNKGASPRIVGNNAVRRGSHALL